MNFALRLLILPACFTALTAQAQIPPQGGGNPNTIPPPGTTRPFSRPGSTVPPQPQRPGGTPARPGGPSGAVNPAAGNAATQTPKAPLNVDDPDGIEVSYPNSPLHDVLLDYEEMTGLKVIRDANAEQATVSIETTGKMPKAIAVMFIEKSLLLNGYSFVPAGDGMVKLLAFDAKKPQTEGAPLYESAADLPDTDQVVSFVTYLKYLNGEDAVKAVDQVIPRHSYGILTPVPNVKALIMVEASHTIRAILGLLERLDTKPAETSSKTFQLTRSDAEDVKKALDEILGTDEKNSGSSGGNRNPSIPQNQQPAIAPGGVSPQQAAAPSYASIGSASTAETIPPKIHAIVRRNCLLVIATPETMDYIGKLIEELDGASELRNFVSRTLNYLGVESAMSIISDAISRGEGQEGGSSGGGVNSLGQNNNQTGTQNNNRTNSFGGANNAFGSSSNTGIGGGGSSGLGGGMGGGSGGANANLTSLRPDNGPRSLVVGKTLLISDPTANSIFASGPPEHLRVLNEIIDELDKRPQQILISVVIGEMNLDNSKGLSVDSFLRGALTGRNNRSSAVAAGLRGSTATLLDPRNVTSLVGDVAAGGFGNALSNGLSLYGGIADGVDVIVKTLETNTNFKVLSRPTIFTMNNRSATITSGVSIPVATSTQGQFNGGVGNTTGLLSNVQYQPVVLSLQILPLINSEDELTLQISQENNEASESTTNISGNEYPELSQQTLNTTVLVKNRATVMLGGLIRESKNRTKSGLPFINRIPLIGAIVGSQSNTTTRRELMIFIQPRIVQGNYDLPPTVEDAPGTSPFSDEIRHLLNQEKANIPEVATPASPRRPDLRGLIKRLFTKTPGARDPNSPFR